VGGSDLKHKNKTQTNHKQLKLGSRSLICIALAFSIFASCLEVPSVFGGETQVSQNITLYGVISNPIQLEWLHTDGSSIKDEKGNNVTLRGCAWQELCYRKTLESDLETRINQMQMYKVNSVRLCLNPAYWSDSAYVGLVDQIVNKLGEKGIYVIIDFHCGTWDYSLWNNDAKIDAIEYPDWWIAWFKNVTARYINDPQVALYNIFNEPPTEGQGYSEEQLQEMWYSVSLRAIQEIHQINPKVVTIVESVNLADKILFIDNPLPEPNVVYGFHRYYYFDRGYEDYALSYEQGNFTIAKLQMESLFNNIAFRMQDTGHPIILLEFGASADDPNWDVQIVDLYNLLNKYNVSWNQWCYYPINPEHSGPFFCLLEPDGLTLSQTGELWREQLNP
jgi:hypothetical protein